MKKTYRSFIIYVLLIIPYIQPAEYVIGSTLQRIYNIYKILSILCIILLYIYRYRNLSKMICYITIFQFVFVFSTCINGNISNIKEQIVQALTIISICMITEYGIKENKKQFLKAMYFVLAVYAIINSYTMIKYNNKGMFIDDLRHWEYYFLGYDNSTFLMIFPLYIYATCYSYIRYGRINLLTWFVLTFVGFSYLYVSSTTAFIMIALFMLYLATYKLKIWEKILNFKTLILIIFAVFIFIVILNGQTYFEDFMAKELNKSATMSGRTYIWDQAKKYIKESPIIGYGCEDYKILMSKFGINHVHNIVLDILYKGGSIAMIAYLIILGRCNKVLKRADETFIKNTILLGLFIYLFTGIFDYNNNKYILFTIFILIENTNRIIENGETNAKN